MNFNSDQKVTILECLGVLTIRPSQLEGMKWYATIEKPGYYLGERRGSVIHTFAEHGTSADEAVDKLFERLTTLSDDCAIEIKRRSGGSVEIRYVRWNGFMWQDVPSPAPLEKGA